MMKTFSLSLHFFPYPPHLSLFLALSLSLSDLIFFCWLFSAPPVGLWNVSVWGEGPLVPLEAIREPLWICAERALFSGVGTEWVGSRGGFMYNLIICLRCFCEPHMNVRFLFVFLKHIFISRHMFLFWGAGGAERHFFTSELHYC